MNAGRFSFQIQENERILNPKSYLGPETSIYKWLFQLDDSRSLFRKLLFRVPGRGLVQIIFLKNGAIFAVPFAVFQGCRWCETDRRKITLTYMLRRG